MADINISKKARKKTGKKGKKSRKDDEAAIRSMRADFKNGDGDDEKPKKSFKTLILALFALILVGAGAGGAWIFLLQPPEEEVAEVVEEPEEVFPKTYIQTEPVHIAFRRGDGRQRRLIVFLTLEVEQKEQNVSNVHQALPRLQEAFWRALNAEPLPGASRDAIELEAVKERVRAASDAVLGPDIVHDVLIRDARSIAG